MKKILFVILHGSVYPERYFNVKNSWGKNVDCLFYPDEENKSKNIVKVSDNKTYFSNEEKHINVLKYLHENVTDYEWYFFCDDDTFVNTKKLDEFMLNADKNKVHGSVINCWGKDNTLEYCSGGAGYLIHNILLSKIYPKLKVMNTGYSDVTLGIVLKETNVSVSNSGLFNSQPPNYYGINDEKLNNHITFHYIKTESEMLKLNQKIYE